MRKFAAFAIAAVVTAGCKDNPQVNPVDAPSVTALQGALTRTSLQTLATGVLAQNRSAVSDLTFYTLAGIYARDVYRIDASEPRFISETLGGQPDPSSFAGGRGWNPFYTSIRAENTLIGAVPGASTNQVSALEKSATLGFLKTMKALDYYDLLSLRDTVGVSIQSPDPDAPFTDIKCKPAVINYIAALLDSAQSDLNAAGATTALPFKLPTGFTAFGRNYTNVSNLLLFNRALKGKVDFYRALNRQAPQPALYTAAIAELTTALGGAAPGAVSASQLAFGPYYVFVPGGTEAAPNSISDARVGLNPIVVDSLQAGDTRASKIVSRATLTGAAPFQSIVTSVTFFGAVSSLTNQARPVGILRDEELVFLRAQAENEASLFAAAAADLNSVRAVYNLAPVAITSVTQGRTLILWDKRYSLLFEGPQRLVDLRAYGFLNNTYLRKEATTDPFNSAFPIPQGERLARSNSFACTA
jgi:hypothetical protein